MIDALEQFSADLTEARRQAANWVDRAQALAEVVIQAEVAAAGLRQHTITVEELVASPKDEQERAELTALITRAYPDIKETE